MRLAALSLVAGVVFGIGLAVSKMVNPAKVLAFLDIAGNWDPSLIFVMGGGVVVFAVAFHLIHPRGRPLLAEAFSLPSAKEIDVRLIGGSVLFGVGWGLVGYCPGPAITSLAYGRGESLIFLIALVAGAALYNLVPRPTRPEGSLTVDA